MFCLLEIPKNEMETTWKSPNSAKDPEKADLNVTKDSWDGLSPGETKPAPVEPVVQSRVVDSYASKLEKQRLDQIKNRRLSMGYYTFFVLQSSIFHNRNGAMLSPTHLLMMV